MNDGLVDVFRLFALNFLMQHAWLETFFCFGVNFGGEKNITRKMSTPIMTTTITTRNGHLVLSTSIGLREMFSLHIEHGCDA